jgi:hypothetical protein
LKDTKVFPAIAETRNESEKENGNWPVADLGFSGGSVLHVSAGCRLWQDIVGIENRLSSAQREHCEI